MDGLRKTITTSGVKRVDFCVGYFNLRGWDQIADQVDLLEGEQVREIDATMQRPVMVERKCRLLIGMYRPDEEIIRELYSCREVEPLDTEHLLRYKMKVAEDFRHYVNFLREHFRSYVNLFCDYSIISQWPPFFPSTRLILPSVLSLLILL